MKRSILLLFPVVFLLSMPLWPEEISPDKPVRVEEVTYLIAESRERRAGITREPALRRYYGINVGDIYDSRENLEKKLEQVTRELNGLHIYKEIYYEVSYWDEENLFAPSRQTAHISITVEDSLSLYLFPYVLYDSNLGMVFGGNFNYNNMLGTLTNLNLQGYGGSETWRAGGMWENVPLGGIRGDFFLFCEQERNRRVDNQDRTVLEYTNLLLDAYIKIDIPLGYGWELSSQPGVSFPFYYNLVSWDPSYGRDEYDTLEPVTSGYFKEGVGYANVFWEENFRIGVEGTAFITVENDLDKWDPLYSLDGSLSTFYRPLNFLGLGHHASAFCVFDGTREGAGSHIRGVLDHLMYGDWGMFINNNVDVRAVSLPPFVEIHCYPFLDGGVVYDSTTPYHAYDYRLTAGFGVTFFPLFLQSLQLNVEAGYDLLNEGLPEITFKSELFF